MKNDVILTIWTIYEKPTDYPNDFVARPFVIIRGQPPKALDKVYTAPTLAKIRACIPLGLHRLPRAPDDDPVIVETWF